MGGLKTSLVKEWYRRSTRRRLRKEQWPSDYWVERDGARIIPCRKCLKFDAASQTCRVPFGSPLRKCVVAAIEVNLRCAPGTRALEIGFGRRSLAKEVIETSGGVWTGIEPLAARDEKPAIGGSGYGHVADIPFGDGSFDLVYGIQSFEHWSEPVPGLDESFDHQTCLDEVWRVLKTGGGLYVDAPIHLHGHEMFVAGDIDRIVGLFDVDKWVLLKLEKWRYEHEPLPRYATPAADAADWARSVTSYSQSRLREIETERSVWLVTVTAMKRG